MWTKSSGICICLFLSQKVLGSGCHALIFIFYASLISTETQGDSEPKKKKSFPLLLIPEKNSLPPFQDVHGAASEALENKRHLSPSVHISNAYLTTWHINDIQQWLNKINKQMSAWFSAMTLRILANSMQYLEIKQKAGSM